MPDIPCPIVLKTFPCKDQYSALDEEFILCYYHPSEITKANKLKRKGVKMMKKIMIGILAVLCMVLFVSAAFAGEKEEASWFKPALSVGYAFDAVDPHFTFTTRGAPLIGGTNIDIEPPRLSGIYTALELPFAVTDRLKLALSGSLTSNLTSDDMDETYNFGTIRRSWDLDNSNNRWSADFLASYAFVKDLSFIKDISAVAGVRWDYQTARYDEPFNVMGVLSGPGDTEEFTMYTLAPVFGLTSTFKGYKYGIFGGDIKLGLLGGPIVFGHLDYKEKFGNGALSWHFDDDLNSGGYLFKVFGEITALSGKIAPAIDGSLSIFAQCTVSKAGGTLDGTANTGATQGFDFESDSSVVAIGLKAAITF